MAIYKVGVVGAGTMGAGIAQVISYNGTPVVLKEVNDEFLQRGMGTIRKVYEGRVAKKRMTPEEMEQKMKLVTPTTRYSDFKDVDLVIEAVPEILKIKLEIFKALDEACPASAILATNTSALSISGIASSTKRPEKVVGMHFFYPAHFMKLVEVIPGLVTSDETVEEVTSFAESLRKLPVKVKECPGFLVNRLLMPYLNEAVLALEEGAASIEQIDQAMKAQGWPMGPFTLIDALGLDICAEAGKVLWQGYGDRMKPAQLWERLLELKRFGRKSGKGFYDYTQGGPADPGKPDPAFEKEIEAVRAKAGIRKTEFSAERLMVLIINEAVLALQEGISSASEIEIGVMAGLGYPASKGGLLHAADALGIDTLVDSLDRHTQQLGFRFHPSHRLRTMRNAGFLGTKTKRGFFSY
ncbi:MAG: 3-hydroxyacyl-CoA dehydrogenase NAD-binding domain-containing protein [Candidatus Omnitrophota bacterium]|nr:3-hydroxyacyl-CoA dehydrogenase NAD-binding domain-containing protein [Candidatus Omnitrophota bacterium]